MIDKKPGMLAPPVPSPPFEVFLGGSPATVLPDGRGLQLELGAVLVLSPKCWLRKIHRRTDGRTDAVGRTDGNFCGRRRRGRGPADGAPAAAAAPAKIEKQITSERPPVKKRLAPDGRPPTKTNVEF